MYIAQWHEQAKNDPVERAYIEQMGLAPFVNMSWADPNSAPRMQLIEEFINGAVHHPDRMEAEVDGKTCVIDVALITRFLHLPIGDTAEILAEPKLDRRRLIEYQGLEPKQPGGYSITQGHQNHILRKQIFIQTFMFKRKPTYISENAIRQWVWAEILANKDEMWGWALCMFRELVKEVKECKKGRTTICISAEVLDRLLDLYFPHSTHPIQKATAQREDDLRRAKRMKGTDSMVPTTLYSANHQSALWMKPVRAAEQSQFLTRSTHYRPRSRSHNRPQDHRRRYWTKDPARTPKTGQRG